MSAQLAEWDRRDNERGRRMAETAAADAGRRIQFGRWGTGVRHLCGRLPAYAVVTDQDDSDVGAVCRAIGSRTGLTVVTCRLDGHSQPSGDAHYELTLGRRVSSGGYSAEGSLWISISALEAP